MVYYSYFGASCPIDIHKQQGVFILTEKELKKLNRYQLLELLVVQTQRADRLQQELDTVRAQLEQQNIRLSNLGSIAEASLQITGIFEAAQKAADLYLDAAKLQARIIEDEAKKTARTILANAEITGKFAAVLQPKSLDD